MSKKDKLEKNELAHQLIIRTTGSFKISIDALIIKKKMEKIRKLDIIGVSQNNNKQQRTVITQDKLKNNSVN